LSRGSKSSRKCPQSLGKYAERRGIATALGFFVCSKRSFELGTAQGRAHWPFPAGADFEQTARRRVRPLVGLGVIFVSKKRDQKGGNGGAGSRVPAGRMERLARLGFTATRLAVGAMAEGTRRLASGIPASASEMILTAANAEILAKELSRMRGAAMKLGQMLSLEADVGLPAEFAQILSLLRSNADFMPSAQLHRVLGREYGKGWRDRFLEFDETPIAAASIGQVHRAVTLDGRELALKVQFPGVAKSIDSDVDNLGALLRMIRVLPAGFELKPLLEAVKGQLRKEIDYTTEAESMQRFAGLLGDDPDFLVPEPDFEHTTKRVLAMSFAAGEPLASLWEDDYPERVRDGAGRALQRLTLRELFEFGFMQSDPNFANFLWNPELKKIVLLDFGSMIEIEQSVRDGYAELCRAALKKDREGVGAALVGLEWTTEGERADRVDALIDLVLISCEPIRRRGRYDFGQTELADQARQLGLDLAFGKGFFRPPPPVCIFLHRKLGGTYLVCAQLRAKVDCRKILRELIEF
jgi:predicted unusual protein kinase regulating ubiquinone biosynthesis (AarF/ABC1/UbiB family)